MYSNYNLEIIFNTVHAIVKVQTEVKLYKYPY